MATLLRGYALVRCCLDITRNIFYSFRGPAAEEDVSHQRQLENNLTKSLVTVLEHADRNIFLRSFLKELRLPFAKDVLFSLQRKPIATGPTKRRIILSITGGSPEVMEHQAQRREDDHKGRPDARLCTSGWAVLVESKIGRRLNARQIRGHANGEAWQTYGTVHWTWQRLHKLFAEALSKYPNCDQLSRLLVGHWLTYLEYQNMVEFEKLDTSDFDFCNLSGEERRAMLPRMKSRLHAFARLLARSAPSKQVAALYAKRKAQDWKYGSTWFNIGGEPSASTWHVTVFFKPSGIEVELLASRNHLTRKLCRSGVNCFSNVVNMAANAKDVRVGCRRAWYRDPDSPYKGQHIGRVDHPMMVQPSTLNDSSRAHYAMMLKETLQGMLKNRQLRSELILAREIPRREIALPKTTVQQQVALVAEAVRELQPILTYLMQATKGC